jgi:hypothetical protein
LMDPTYSTLPPSSNNGMWNGVASNGIDKKKERIVGGYIVEKSLFNTMGRYKWSVFFILP